MLATIKRIKIKPPRITVVLVVIIGLTLCSHSVSLCLPGSSPGGSSELSLLPSMMAAVDFIERADGECSDQIERKSVGIFQNRMKLEL